MPIFNHPVQTREEMGKNVVFKPPYREEREEMRYNVDRQVNRKRESTCKYKLIDL